MSLTKNQYQPKAVVFWTLFLTKFDCIHIGWWVWSCYQGSFSPWLTLSCFFLFGWYLHIHIRYWIIGCHTLINNGLWFLFGAFMHRKYFWYHVWQLLLFYSGLLDTSIPYGDVAWSSILFAQSSYAMKVLCLIIYLSYTTSCMILNDLPPGKK